MKADYYRVLGVAPGASDREIRLAYRALARSEHPDRRAASGVGGAAQMALVNEAFETLGDSARRRRYDLRRQVPEPPEVLDAILGAARAMLGPGLGAWTPAVGDFVFSGAGVRISVRLVPFMGAGELGEWLRAAGVAVGSGKCGLAVVLAGRLLDPDEVALLLSGVRFPAVAIDLIEGRPFGRFASDATAEVFRAFLG